MKAGDAAVGLVACGTAWAVYLTKTRVDPFLSRRPFATVFGGGGGGGGGGRGHIVSSVALWKVVNVASYAMNVVSVSIPGRIDDQMAKEMKENKNNNSNKKTTIVTTIKMTSRIERRTSEETRNIGLCLRRLDTRLLSGVYFYQRIRVCDAVVVF